MSVGTLVASPSSRLPFGDTGSLDELVVALWEGLRADRSVVVGREECGGHVEVVLRREVSHMRARARHCYV